VVVRIILFFGLLTFSVRNGDAMEALSRLNPGRNVRLVGSKLNGFGAGT
jgi:hypothetical protein